MCLHGALSSIPFDLICNSTGKLAPISQKCPNLWRKQIFVNIDEKFAINGIHSKFPTPSLRGKFGIGVTERVLHKRIYTSSQCTVIQRLCIAYSCCLKTHKVQSLI